MPTFEELMQGLGNVALAPVRGVRNFLGGPGVAELPVGDQIGRSLAGFAALNAGPYPFMAAQQAFQDADAARAEAPFRAAEQQLRALKLSIQQRVVSDPDSTPVDIMRTLGLDPTVAQLNETNQETVDRLFGKKPELMGRMTTSMRVRGGVAEQTMTEIDPTQGVLVGEDEIQQGLDTAIRETAPGQRAFIQRIAPMANGTPRAVIKRVEDPLAQAALRAAGTAYGQNIDPQRLMGSGVLPGPARQPTRQPLPVPGMVAPGNIDLAQRPVVHNADGTVSTLRSISVNVDGVETLIPTLDLEGRQLTDDQAIAHYQRTGQHLGQFDTPAHATAFAAQLSQRQGQGRGRPPLPSGTATAQMEAFAATQPPATTGPAPSTPMAPPLDLPAFALPPGVEPGSAKAIELEASYNQQVRGAQLTAAAAEAASRRPGPKQREEAAQTGRLRQSIADLRTAFEEASGQSLAGRGAVGSAVESVTGGQATGVMANLVKTPLARFTSLSTEGQRKLIANEARVKNAYIKAITGAQLSREEAVRIGRQLPQLSNDPQFFLTALDGLERDLAVLTAERGQQFPALSGEDAETVRSALGWEDAATLLKREADAPVGPTKQMLQLEGGTLEID